MPVVTQVVTEGIVTCSPVLEQLLPDLHARLCPDYNLTALSRQLLQNLLYYVL
jgi:hypothetical protein